MTNQGPTYSPDYRSETSRGTGLHCVRCSAHLENVAYTYSAIGQPVCMKCCGQERPATLEMKSAQPYSGPPRTLDDYDFAKLRAEAAIRIYCALLPLNEAAGNHSRPSEAVSHADSLISELRDRPMPSLLAEEGGT